MKDFDHLSNIYEEAIALDGIDVAVPSQSFLRFKSTASEETIDDPNDTCPVDGNKVYPEFNVVPFLTTSAYGNSKVDQVRVLTLSFEKVSVLPVLLPVFGESVS
jgi:hypothetical protein